MQAIGFVGLFAVAAVVVAVAGTAALVRGLMRPPRKTLGVALAMGLPQDPGEAGLAFESMRLSLSDGGETPAWLVEGRRADGPAVVVVHGFGDSRYGALTWAELLLPHASKLLFYDLRGHGEAESRNAHCGTTDIADLLAILDQLRPDRPVVLFGYSMGGGIAIAAAAQDDAVAGVIADGPYRLWDEPIRHHLRARRLPRWPFVKLAEWALRVMLPAFSPRRFDRAEHARRLRCPLLILHGDDDHLCPLASARALVDAAPDGELVVIEGGGHLDLPLHDEPRYRAALAAFFDRIAASRGRAG